MISQKIRKIFFGILIILVPIFIGACSAKMIGNSKLNLSIEILKSNAWINLMPGINMKPSFHFTGEVIIKNNSSDIIKNLNLQEIEIYTDSILVYQFSPKFLNKENDSTNSILSSEEKTFSFSSPKGLILKNELNQKKMCNALLKFSAEGATIECKIKNIQIEKVY